MWAQGPSKRGTLKSKKQTTNTEEAERYENQLPSIHSHSLSCVHGHEVFCVCPNPMEATPSSLAQNLPPIPDGSGFLEKTASSASRTSNSSMTAPNLSQTQSR